MSTTDTTNQQQIELELSQIEADPEGAGALLRLGDSAGALDVHGDPSWVRVGYRDEAFQCGFDLTAFHDVEAFLDVLDALDLDPVRDFYLVESYPDIHPAEDGTYLLAVWASDEGFIVCGCNPITGTYREPDVRSPEPGYASYIGVEGAEAFRDTAWNVIREESRHNKDYDMKGRGYI